MEKDAFCLRIPLYHERDFFITFWYSKGRRKQRPYAMIPVCRLTIYKDVPYTVLFMNRIRTPKEKDRDSDSGGYAAGSSHGGGGRYF